MPSDLRRATSRNLTRKLELRSELFLISAKNPDQTISDVLANLQNSNRRKAKKYDFDQQYSQVPGLTAVAKDPLIVSETTEFSLETCHDRVHTYLDRDATDMNDANSIESGAESATRDKSPDFWIRIVIASVFIGGIVYLFLSYGSEEILSFLTAQEARAEAFRSEYPVATYCIAFLLYVAVTGLSLPGAIALTIVYGWFFDFVPALILISFASTIGATFAFLMSRYLLRSSIQDRFGERLESFNQALEREGAIYLFTLRLIPAVPFFVINLVMGLTPIRTRTFWWVSQLGMLPGTVIYIYAGHSFPEIRAIQSVVDEHGVGGLLTHSGSEINLSNLFLALILLGLFPVALKFIMRKLKRTPSTPDETLPTNSKSNS